MDYVDVKIVELSLSTFFPFFFQTILIPFPPVQFTFGWSSKQANSGAVVRYLPIIYYWTGFLILDHSYLVGNLTNSKIAQTKALEPLKS
jgi:hypothetical protein